MKTIKNLLEEKGFFEGVDYEVNLAGELVALPKIRVVDGVDETYYENVPTLAEMEIALENYKLSTIPDLIQAIDEYVKQFPNSRTEDDELNADTIIHRWGFPNIPKPTYAELIVHYQNALAKTSEVLVRQNLIESGKRMRQSCENVLNLVAGYNNTNLASDTDKTQMSITFAPIVQQLLIIRPGQAKKLITAVDTTGNIYLENLKQILLAELKEY